MVVQKNIADGRVGWVSIDPLSHLSVMIFVDKCPNITSSAVLVSVFNKEKVRGTFSGRCEISRSLVVVSD